MTIKAPAPARFVEAKDVKWARFSNSAPQFATRLHRRTGRRLQGVKYEKQVHEMLYNTCKGMYLASPWLHFATPGGVKWCQPDGLLFDFEAGIVTIIEVKYQHTTDAWWQLRRLYEPVLRHIFPASLWDFRIIELVKWYDPAVEWPEKVCLVAKVSEMRMLKANVTGVHIWKA